VGVRGMDPDRNRSLLDRIVFAGVVGLLVFAPLAFGSVHVWAYSILCTGVFLLCLFKILDLFVFSGKGKFVWIRTPITVPLLLILAVIILQLVPLPHAALRLISPQTAADRAVLTEIFKQAGHFKANFSSLAYYRHPVIIEGLKLAAYAGMFFLVLYTACTRRRIDILICVLIAVGLFEALYAIYQVFSEVPRVWWWKSRSGAGRFASGTYIVSNHFAGYMELIVPLTAGFMLAHRQRSRRMLSGLGGLRAWTQQVVDWFSPESARPKMILLFFTAVIMGVALLLSASRGGILSMGASLLLVSVLFASKHRYRGYAALFFSLCLFAFIYAAHIGIDPTFDKFRQSEAGLDKRLLTFRSMFPMIGDYPLLGVGLGNFRYLYPRYVPKEHDGVSSSGYSHNDWLEAGTEIGLIGAGLIFLGFIFYLYRLIRTWRARSDPYVLGIGAGAVTALLSLGFHSLSDFNMHIPANPITLAALLAVGYGAVFSQKRGVRETRFYPTVSIQITPLRRLVCIGCCVLVFGLFSFGIGRHFFAEVVCPSEWNSTMNLNWNPHLSDIRKAIVRNPANAEYHWKEAGYYINARIRDDAVRRNYNERAIRSLQKAVFLNPARGIYWFYLGKRYSFRSYDPFGYLKQWLPVAEDCFDVAIRCAPMNATILFDVAWYWVWRSGLFSEKGNPDQKGNTSTVLYREDGIGKFQGLFQRALELSPGRWQQAVDRVWEYYPDDRIVLGIVPAEDEKMKSRVLRYVARKGH